MKLRQNWTIIVAVVLAIVMLSAALLFRPMRLVKEPATSQFYDTTSQDSASYRQVSEVNNINESEETESESGGSLQVNLTDSLTATQTEPQSDAETTRVILPATTQNRTETSTATTEQKIESKFVSLIDKTAKKLKKETTTESYSMTPSEFRRAGVIYYNGYKFTYYSEKVLPGKGLKIPGRHSDGNFVRDVNNYICVASSDLPKGAVVDTPFGEGKVYDTGCPSGVIDIYCSF